MQPTKLSQSQAARAAGVSRTSIWRAVKSGQLSAERAEDGSLRIDLSELMRVFPEANAERVRTPALNADVNVSERVRTPEHAGEVQALRLLVDELRASQSTQREEVGFLRAELSRAREERERLLSVVEKQSEQVRLLTDQRERTERRPWWQRWRRAY